MFVLSFIYLCLSSKTVANLPVSLGFGLFILMRQYGTCYFFFSLWNEENILDKVKLDFAWVLTSWIFYSSFLCCGVMEQQSSWAVCPCGQGDPSWEQQAEHCQQDREVILPLEYLIQLQVSHGAPGAGYFKGDGWVMRRDCESWVCVARRGDEWERTSSLSARVCRELKEPFAFGWAIHD